MSAARSDMLTNPPHGGDTFLAYLHPNDVTASFMRSLMNLQGYDAQEGGRYLQQFAAVKCGSTGIPEGRNQCAETFLQTDCEWLFFVDADMGFEPMGLEMLRRFADPVERPIVGGLAFANREITQDGLNGFRTLPSPTIFDYVTNADGVSQFMGRSHYPVNTLMRCAATGTAFLLIHRSVLEAIAASDEPGLGPKSWFERIKTQDGKWLGEDISFFARVARFGFPVHVHTGIRTNHQKTIWVGEDTFWDSFLAPSATDEVDVIVPVLHRPDNVAPFMQSLRASTGLAHAWFVCEPGDTEQINAVKEHGGNVLEYPGSFAQKVNWAFTMLRSRPWVFLAGDDVRFRAGWLDHAQDVARRYGAKVVGTNDLGNPRVMRGEHATHMLISTAYVDEVGASWDGPGIVCHEGYRHWFVDDEIVTAAKRRGVFQAALGSLVEHMHPLFGKGAEDDVYRLGVQSSKADETVFRKRVRAHAS